MKVKCIINRLNNVNPFILIKPEGPINEYDDNYYVSSRDYYTIDSNTNGYNLYIDEIYIVYGIMVFQNEMRYLLATTDIGPQWYPQQLFEIIDSMLPCDFHCGKFPSNNNTGMIISYKELATDYSQLIGLMELSPKAIEKFNVNKIEIDSYY